MLLTGCLRWIQPVQGKSVFCGLILYPNIKFLIFSNWLFELDFQSVTKIWIRVQNLKVEFITLAIFNVNDTQSSDIKYHIFQLLHQRLKS